MECWRLCAHAAWQWRVLARLKRQQQLQQTATCQTSAGGGTHHIMHHLCCPHSCRLCCLSCCCTGGTLIEAIANAGGKLPERQVAMKVALPLLNALRQLHTTGIVHRWDALPRST